MLQVGLATDPPIHFSYDGVVANTLDSHRLIEYGHAHGRQDAVVEALFQRYFEREANIGDTAVLLEAAEEAGLERGPVQRMLAGAGDEDADADAQRVVQTAETLRQRHRIDGVPFFIFNGQLAFSGAQEPGAILECFDQVRG
eukprot:g386.t1